MKMFKMLAMTGAMVAGSAAMAQEKFITIGTGGQTGVYFVVGQSICRLVNRGTADHNLKCTAPSTGGSIANINAIKAGDMDMGVAQSDWQFHAYNGTDKFADAGAYEDLRAEAAADVPLKMFSTPEDIAEMALFLVSDQARTITGQAINVDAGFTI